MATLADQRRAIAEGMRQARQATGAAERRATGDAMIRRRTGRDEVADINALVDQPRIRNNLRTLEPRGGLPAQRGRGTYTAPASSSGGGVDSPLTVQSIIYADEPALVETFDGSGLFRVRAAASITMTDNAGREIVINGFNSVSSVGMP